MNEAFVVLNWDTPSDTACNLSRDIKYKLQTQRLTELGPVAFDRKGNGCECDRVANHHFHQPPPPSVDFLVSVPSPHVQRQYSEILVSAEPFHTSLHVLSAC